MTQLKRARRKRWAVSVGVKGRNRVRAYEHSNGRLYLQWQGGSQPLTTTNRLEAAKLAEAKAAAMLHHKRGELTLGALFDMYLEDVAKYNTNFKARKRGFDLMRATWGAQRLAQSLSLRDTDRYVRDRSSGAISPPNGKAKPVRARVVQEDLEGLRAALNWALKVRDPDGKYLLAENPLRGLTLPKELNVRRVRLDLGEYQALLLAGQQVDLSGRFVLALQLAQATGHRLSSIRQLRWADIDFAGSTIFWAGEFQKNGLDHRTPVEAELLAALQAMRDRYPKWTYVFQVTRGPAKALEREQFYTWWRQVRQVAKLPKKEGAGWHMFRRELASDLSDAPLAIVKELMGSKNPHVLVNVYQEPRMRQLRQALANRSELITGPPAA